ncbi:MAG: putative maltokinase [Acidobacteriota bacterium]|nr:putative maltokinase [Acidobacteriota bacterium]
MVLPQIDARFAERLRTAVAAQLPEFLPHQRWFRSKARRIQSAQLSDCIPVPVPRSVALVALVAVEFSEGGAETYVVPLIASPPGRACPPEAIAVRLPASSADSGQILIDALSDAEFLSEIFRAIVNASSFAGQCGELYASPEPGLEEDRPSSATALPQPRLLRGEQSNSSIVFGDRFILKFFRRVEEGVHPDLEIGRFLASIAHFQNVPPVCGSLSYRTNASGVMTLGILQRFIPNRGDAWRQTVDSLVELFASPDHPTGEALPGSVRPSASNAKSNPAVCEPSARFGKQLELVRLLGTRTAELHLALASSGAHPAFAPERFTPELRERMEVAFHDLVVHNFAMLRLKIAELPNPVAGLTEDILKLEDDALLVRHSILEKEISSIRIRIHGDYHLGQVLFTGSDFFIIDFEGEPARSLSQRRDKRSPLQDVAGMLRSFHYAACAASGLAKQRLAGLPGAGSNVDALAAEWQTLASVEFLRSYRSTVGDATFVPADSVEFDALLRIFLLEKAVYELGYELNNRPTWLYIPLQGIRDILSAPKTP